MKHDVDVTAATRAGAPHLPPRVLGLPPSSSEDPVAQECGSFPRLLQQLNFKMNVMLFVGFRYFRSTLGSSLQNLIIIPHRIQMPHPKLLHITKPGDSCLKSM